MKIQFLKEGQNFNLNVSDYMIILCFKNIGEVPGIRPNVFFHRILMIIFPGTSSDMLMKGIGKTIPRLFS